ncbi:mms19 nucleotide excision repair [Cladochytrium tenue]|nr:mms19 nucleotide excision repair [Cladochytrium tenue]
MKFLGPTFVNGYFQAIDNEKDPHNLLLAFQTLEIMCKSFDISASVAEAFDTFSVYFPITFKTPAGDVSGITPEDLKLALSQNASAAVEGSAFQKLLKLVSDECLACFKDSDAKDAKGSGLVMEAVCVSVVACDYIVQSTFPALLERLSTCPGLPVRANLLELSTHGIGAARKVFSNLPGSEACGSDLGLLRRAGITGLVELFLSALVQTADELVIFRQTQWLFNDVNDAELHQLMIGMVTSMARTRADTVVPGLVLPLIQNALESKGKAPDYIRPLLMRLAEVHSAFSSIVDHLRDCVEEQKPFYIFCLSQVMQIVPSYVLVPSLPQIMPLLLVSLSSDAPTVQLATLKTLEHLAADSPTSVAPSVADLIDRTLAVCSQNGALQPPVSVRSSALRLLGSLAHSPLPYTVLHPLRARVLRGLQASLDDRKRTVRKEAADARLRWFLLLGPKEQ